MSITCSKCSLGPFDGRSLYRDKGALFNKGNSLKGVGPLFCAQHAPEKIKKAILSHPAIDPTTKSLVMAGA